MINFYSSVNTNFLLLWSMPDQIKIKPNLSTYNAALIRFSEGSDLICSRLKFLFFSVHGKLFLIPHCWRIYNGSNPFQHQIAKSKERFIVLLKHVTTVSNAASRQDHLKVSLCLSHQRRVGLHVTTHHRSLLGWLMSAIDWQTCLEIWVICSYAASSVKKPFFTVIFVEIGSNKNIQVILINLFKNKLFALGLKHV